MKYALAIALLVVGCEAKIHLGKSVNSTERCYYSLNNPQLRCKRISTGKWVQGIDCSDNGRPIPKIDNWVNVVEDNCD